MLPPPPCSYSGADMQSAGNSAEPRPNARSYRLVWPARSCSWLSDGVPRCAAPCTLLLISVHVALRDRAASRRSFAADPRALCVLSTSRAQHGPSAWPGRRRALCPREMEIGRRSWGASAARYRDFTEGSTEGGISDTDYSDFRCDFTGLLRFQMRLILADTQIKQVI